MRASNHHHHHHQHHHQHITNTCHQDARKSSLIGSSDNDGACEDRQYQQHQLLHHHHQHQHLLLEAKRSSGDNKEAIDDNIKKHNTNNNYHNHHNHHHHHHHHNYYNTHNFHQNFHHQQQQLNKHPHLHFQPAQTTNTNATTTTNQTAQQQQHVMAHYKFHNDCQSSVLTYEQVKRLDFVMDQVVPIHGRGNAPTLYVKLKELIRLVKFKLQNEHSIEIRDVRLNGGAASYVLAPENSHYNDLDLVFGIDLTSEDRFDVIRDVVLECLMEFYPKLDECVSQQQQQPSQQSQKQQCEQSLVVGLSAMSNDDNHHYDAGTTSDESESQSSRSQRSSSFESDNMMINLTTNDDESEEEEEDDDEGDIIVRIDSDEAYEKKKKNEEDNQQQGDNIQENQDRQSNSIEEMINSSETTKLDTPPPPREVEANGVIITSPSEEVYDNATQQQQVVYHQYAGQMPPISCATKEAYVHKMVKVNDDDRWSLISLGVQQSETTTNYNHLNHHHGQQLHQSSDCVQVGVGYPAGELNDNLKCCNGVTTTYQQGQQQQQQQQPKQQSPNSIELKFVDRMRRKFEFSVDSFQIILDSLIQFYDYAPQSTITIQRKASPCCCQQQTATATTTNTSARHVCNVGGGYCTGGFSHISHPTRRIHSATPADNNNHVCVDHISTKASHRSHQPGNNNNNNKTQVIVNNFLDNEKEHIRHNNHHHQHHRHQHQHHKDCKAVLSGSASYYELSLDPSNSLSNSSVASSSGCSSSSSVVSSSSSSLSSCDEDHEDLYNDVDSSSPSSSSSASTSSLLSSTTVSITSSSSSTSATKNGTKKCDHQDHQQLATRRVCDDDDDDDDDDDNDDDDDESVKVHENRRKSTTTTKVARSSVVDCSKCFEKLHLNTTEKQQNKSQKQVGVADLYGRKNPSSCDLGRGASKLSSCAVISENFYPTVIGRSEYGNFKEALYHLEKKLIATRSPEEIRGGGLLKYCNLLVKQYKPTNVYQIRTLERYMCSRFFIDFSDLNQQRAKLESYLANHFSDDTVQKFDYLTILHNVVQRSTVCLMNHELRLTLNMIRELAYELNEQQQQQQQQHQGQSQPLHLAQRVATQQQPIFSQATRQQQQQQHDQHQYQQQQKPIMLQSGVYRVKLVNYALAKPAKS